MGLSPIANSVRNMSRECAESTGFLDSRMGKTARTTAGLETALSWVSAQWVTLNSSAISSGFWGVWRLAILLCCVQSPLLQAVEDYDLVIDGGRVIDPETHMDAVRSVGIRNGRIEAISEAALEGRERLDASGLVVAPGFINLHSHSVAAPGYRLELLDGVTTVLELEAGRFPVPRREHATNAAALTHYGASVGHAWIRMSVIDPEGLREVARSGKVDMSGPAFTQVASDDQREQIEKLIAREIEAGGLGIGFLLDYMASAVDEAERDMVFRVAAQRGVPVFAHVRRGIDGDPAGLDEIIAAAEQAGASAHICHINASAMSGVSVWLDKIDAARARGVDVTTEMFPWTAGSALIYSDVFSRDWRRIFSIDYGDVQWAETGEWLTEETFERYQQERPDGQTMHHYIREEWNRLAIERPHVMVASDAMPLTSYDRKVVPNGAGTSASILGQYVREEQLLTLSDALARLSLLPARRLESFAPAFARKGRLQLGADADIVVFDADTIGARASYLEPFAPAAGLRAVIVGGAIAAHDGELLAETHGGALITASP